MDRRIPALPPLAMVNLTNLIDVCLTLLIIFMLTAPMMRSSIEVNLPRTANAPALTDAGITVAVTADTLVYVNDQPVARAALAQVLQVVREQHPGAGVYIQADRTVAYGTVAEIIGELKAMGIDDVGLVTASREEKKETVRQEAFFSLALHAGVLLALAVVSALHFSTTRQGIPLPARVRLLSMPPAPEMPAASTVAAARKASGSTNAPKQAPGFTITTDQSGVPSHYLGLVVAKIGQNWRNPATRGALVLRCLVRFQIDPAGAVGAVAVESSSGNALFDQAALRAVYEARRFPPLPDDLRDGPLTVHFEFEFAPEK